MELIRKIIQNKYDLVCSHILTYIEKQKRYTQQELEDFAKNAQNTSKKIDPNGKQDFIINVHRRDVKFGLFGNISGKALHHKKVDFG